MKMLSEMHGQAKAQGSWRSRDAASGSANVKARSISGWLRTRLRRGDEGQTLVEIALVMPLLLALVYGMFSIGLGMIVYQQLGEAAFAGDQAMSQYATVKATDLCDKAHTAVTTALSAPAWSAANLNKITYSAILSTADGTQTPIAASTGTFSCLANLSALEDKGMVTLTLSYPYKWMPIFGTNMGTVTMTRTQSVLAQ
jgi:Flp pilus assembly protein TadG